jgi:hypothetical protein
MATTYSTRLNLLQMNLPYPSLQAILVTQTSKAISLNTQNCLNLPLRGFVIWFRRRWVTDKKRYNSLLIISFRITGHPPAWVIKNVLMFVSIQIPMDKSTHISYYCQGIEQRLMVFIL